MKNNNNRENLQEQKIIKCCICGSRITVEESNNPYPVRKWSAFGSDKNRCCHKCNREIVLPCRIAGQCAKSQKEYDNYHKNLMRLPYETIKQVLAET